MSLATKLSVYRAIVLTTLLYASETWTVYQRHTRKLNCFHLNCLRRLLEVKWQDKVQTGMSSVFTMLCKSSAGLDMSLGCLLNDYPSAFSTCHGGQKKCFKDTLKASMMDFGVDHNSWETLAQVRSAWCSAIHKGAAVYKQQCIETAKTE